MPTNTTASRQDLHETANQAGRKVRSLIDNAGEELSGAAESLSTRIKEKPVQSTVIALGLGFLLGAIFRR